MSHEIPKFTLKLLHPRFWLLWLGMGLWWLVAQLPLPVLIAMGKRLGALMYLMGGSRRRIVETNIDLCFPELLADERRLLVRQNFTNYGIAFFEVAIGWWWSNRRLQKITQVEGLEHLENRNGQGALLAAMHFTTLEVGGQALYMRISLDAMYRPHKNPVYEFLQRQSRTRRQANSTIFPRKDVRGVVRALRSGRIVWYAPDQDYGPKQSVFAPFFGVPAATVTATAKLARAGGASVLLFAHYRRADNKSYDLKIFPPLEDFPSGDEIADATRMNQLIEKYIRQQPDQYLWAHRRFKTRPDGEPRLYQK